MKKVKNQIVKYLNEFEKMIFDNAIEITKYKENKLHFHFFAMGIRELLANFLEERSPNEEIKKCPWYKTFHYSLSAPHKITRQQRMAYIICGGLSICEIKQEMNININAYTEKLENTIKELNKYVHIDKATFDTNEYNDKINEVLKILSEFLYFINEFRTSFRDEYTNYISDMVDDELRRDTIAEIDILATHYEDPTFELEKIEMIDITSQNVFFKVVGNVMVIHQYGSDHDNKTDQGYRQKGYYSVKCQVLLDVTETFNNFRENIQFIGLTFDTSSFYE